MRLVLQRVSPLVVYCVYVGTARLDWVSLPLFLYMFHAVCMLQYGDKIIRFLSSSVLLWKWRVVAPPSLFTGWIVPRRAKVRHSGIASGVLIGRGEAIRNSVCSGAYMMNL